MNDVRIVRDFRLPPFSVMLDSVFWQLVTDVSEQPIGSIFKGQVVPEVFMLFWGTI
jgi:hypothetical protein